MEKEKRSKKIKRKLLNKYRLVVLNEDTFEERFTFKLNRLNVFVFSIISALILITTTTIIIAFTSLREYIPGYSSVSLKIKAFLFFFCQKTLFLSRSSKRISNISI